MPAMACNFCARSFRTRGLFNEHVAPFVPELLKYTRHKVVLTDPFHPIPIVRECLRLNDTKKRRILDSPSFRDGVYSLYSEFGRQMTTTLDSTLQERQWKLRDCELLDEAWWTAEVNRVFTAALAEPDRLEQLVKEVYAKASIIAFVPLPTKIADVPLFLGPVRPLSLTTPTPPRSKRLPGITQTANGCFTQAGAVTASGSARIDATTVRHKLLQKASAPIVISDDDFVCARGIFDHKHEEVEQQHDHEGGINIDESGAFYARECDPLFLLNIVVFGMKSISVPVHFNTPLSEVVAAAKETAKHLLRVLPPTTAFVDHHGAVWNEQEFTKIKMEAVEVETVGPPPVIEAEYKGRY